MRIVSPLFLAAALCGACSGTSDTGLTDERAVETPPPPVLPQLVIDAPARGAFVTGPVTIAGNGVEGDATLTTLTINGDEVALTDGSFSTTIDFAPGIGIIGSRLTDADGERTVDGRAVHVGEVHPPGTTLTHAIGIQLGDILFDDDDPDLDDMAAVIQAVLGDPSFVQLLGAAPISQGSLTIEINGFTAGDVEVDVTPFDGKIEMDVYLTDVRIDFHVTKSGFPSLDGDGLMTMDEFVVNMDVALGNDANGITVDVPLAFASIDQFYWEVDGISSSITNGLSDTVEAIIEEQLETKSKDIITGLLGDTLNAFAVDLNIGPDDAVAIHINLDSAELSTDGLVMWMNGSVKANREGVTVPQGAGSLKTPGAGPTLPQNGNIALRAVLDDDFVNQALYGFWESGMLTGWDFIGLELILLTGEDLPPPLGPVKRMIMGLQLPPVISPPTGDGGVDMSMGEFWMQIEREDGVHVDASLNMRIAGEVVPTDDGISIQLDNRPSKVLVHAGMMAYPEALDPGDLASLFRLSAPTLMGKASGRFPSFPAPAIPLGEFVDVDALDGVEWRFTNIDTSMDQSGWMTLTADVSE